MIIPNCIHVAICCPSFHPALDFFQIPEYILFRAWLVPSREQGTVSVNGTVLFMSENPLWEQGAFYTLSVRNCRRRA